MAGNPSIRIYVNKIETEVTFEVKTSYYLECLTPETMKLLGSTKSKITKDQNGEINPNLEITEAALVRSKIVNNVYQKSCIHLFQTNY